MSIWKRIEAAQFQMNSITTHLERTGFDPGYFALKFGIDTEYYKDFLQSAADFAELVVLYLDKTVRGKIIGELQGNNNL